jgi:hypothetical protein
MKLLIVGVILAITNALRANQEYHKTIGQVCITDKDCPENKACTGWFPWAHCMYR